MANAPSAPSEFKLGSTFFSIGGITTLAKEINITIKYSDEDVAAAGGDPQRLALAYYDEGTGKWKVLATTVDSTGKTLSTTTDHLSTWAVLVKTEWTLFGLPIWAWAVIGAVVVISAGIVIGRRLARR